MKPKWRWAAGCHGSSAQLIKLYQRKVTSVTFGNDREPVLLALSQEKTVTEQIARLVQIAREDEDPVGERFLGWFLDEQREEVASMSSLLAVVDRAGTDNMLLVEDYLARGSVTADEPSVPAPPAAGGAL